MTLLLDRRYPRSLETLTRDILARHAAGERFGPVEAWLFEDAAARRAAEARLAAAGLHVRIRSALKPLVTWAMEDLDRDGLTGLDIRYPRHEAAPERRFLLEAWPLAEILPGIAVRFHPGPEGDMPAYRATLTRRDGSTEDHVILAPNRLHPDTTGETALSPTGWLRVTGPDGQPVEDRALTTEVETLLADGIAALADHPWPAETPHFERLSIRADLPQAETPLPHGSEVISLQEALHEEFYFATIELLQRRAGLAPGDRSHRPGQIAPDIRRGPEARLTISLEPLDASDTAGPAQALGTAGRALTPAQVGAELAAITGAPFGATSRAGRPVAGRYRAGRDPAVILSAGQHANETSGVVGILRAAKILDAAPDSHFALIPVKNPDGYAQHRALTAQNPFHMHHAARYTALGDDLMARSEPLFERAAMAEAQRLSGADLHINLHGYPAHEWIRPWSGYLPRGFAAWTIPKGFFLILRHRADWRAQAEAFLDATIARLAALPALMAFNRAQIAACETYAGPGGFRMVNGFPCLVSAEADAPAGTMPLPAMTLITEFPDETIEGDDFRFAHDMQTEATLAAYSAYRAMAAQPFPGARAI
ncbi:M14 family metallopeptidase [Acidimangrovimonas sediminis]|uniref:peptidase M14 n=1 Tax=Acidimangrovimonas sediminis TaxID=2056283 RepID=UPI000C800DE3|nr:peptidase M14 [Acidimangrovimonas sediminis]